MLACSPLTDAGGRAPIKSGSNLQQRRADRLNVAKQAREAKRAAVLASRRAPAGPRVVALLPLSESVNVPEAWRALLAACGSTMDEEVPAMTPQVVSPPDVKRARFMLLPPVLGEERYDPFLAVDLGRTAQVVVLLLGPDGEADAAGETILRVLRALGSPPLIALVRSGADNVHDMKARSAAKKRAAATLARHISAEPKVLAADGPTDWTQAVRQLADMAPTLPLWRQHRPQLLAEDARVEMGNENTTMTTLVLRGHLYNHGISVRQAVHIPGSGDFALCRIDEVVENGRAAPNLVVEDAMEDKYATATAPRVLATAEPSEQASLERENVPDPLAGEQTWPTEEELLEAEADRRERSKVKKRRLPKGTSEYQAAWISDDDEDLDDEDVDGDEEMDNGIPGAVPMDDFSDDLHSLLNGATGTEIDMGSEDEIDEEEERLRVAERRRREREDQDYPDEVDTPDDTLARERFGKYRGLKSFRTSPWDPMESLPRDYARVFAFDNFVRYADRVLWWW